MGFAAEQSNAKSSHLYLLWRAKFTTAEQNWAPSSASSFCPHHQLVGPIKDGVVGWFSDDDSNKLFPEGWRAPKPYIPIVKQPASGRSRPLGQ